VNCEKVLNILGLANRAGKCISGEAGCEKAVKSGKAKIVIISQDVSNNTRKKFEDMCRVRNIPIVKIATGAELGRALGKAVRMVVAIGDEQFANMVKKELEDTLLNKYGGGNEWQK